MSADQLLWVPFFGWLHGLKRQPDEFGDQVWRGFINAGAKQLWTLEVMYSAEFKHTLGVTPEQWEVTLVNPRLSDMYGERGFGAESPTLEKAMRLLERDMLELVNAVNALKGD